MLAFYLFLLLKHSIINATFFFSDVLSWDKMRFKLLLSQCIVRATITGFFGSSAADSYSAKLLEGSDNFLTDAVRLQVGCFGMFLFPFLLHKIEVFSLLFFLL